jgi:hypothetical protein
MIDLNPKKKIEDFKETKNEGEISKNLQTPKNYPNKLTDA